MHPFMRADKFINTDFIYLSLELFPAVIDILITPLTYKRKCLTLYIICLVIALELGLCAGKIETYMIAVEQQARERLERLSASFRLKPVDINLLARQVINVFRLC